MADRDSSDARDYVMARLAACRAWLTDALEELDECVGHFVAPEGDLDGGARTAHLEAVDESIGEAARSVQLAQDAIVDIDPEETEPDIPEDDGHDADGDNRGGDAGND